MAVDKSGYALSSSRLQALTSVETAKDGLKLGLWESIKDFFRGGTKREAIETLFKQLYTIDNPVTGELYSKMASSLFDKQLDIFNDIRAFAKPEELSKFKVLTSLTEDGQKWTARLQIDGQDLVGSSGEMDFGNFTDHPTRIKINNDDVANNMLIALIGGNKDGAGFTEGDVKHARKEILHAINQSINVNTKREYSPKSLVSNEDVVAIAGRLKELSAKSNNSILKLMDVKVGAGLFYGEETLVVNNKQLMKSPSQIPGLDADNKSKDIPLEERKSAQLQSNANFHRLRGNSDPLPASAMAQPMTRPRVASSPSFTQEGAVSTFKRSDPFAKKSDDSSPFRTAAFPTTASPPPIPPPPDDDDDIPPPPPPDDDDDIPPPPPPPRDKGAQSTQSGGEVLKRPSIPLPSLPSEGRGR